MVISAGQLRPLHRTMPSFCIANYATKSSISKGSAVVLQLPG